MAIQYAPDSVGNGFIMIIAFHKHHADLSSGDVGVVCSFGAGYSAGSIVIKRR